MDDVKTAEEREEAAHKSVASRILTVSHLAERLKDELRHQWTRSNRQESVAEHSWRLALMCILCFPYLKGSGDFRKAITIAVIHDLVEAEAGDQHFLISDPKAIEEQASNEKKAIQRIKTMLNSNNGNDLFNLWHEFDTLSSYEAKVIKALDKIEGYLQQNEADIATWTEEETISVFYYLDQFCDFDPFISELKEQVISESLAKIKSSCLDLNEIGKKVESMSFTHPSIKRRLEHLYAKV